jgi:hypothetical protein
MLRKVARSESAAGWDGAVREGAMTATSDMLEAYRALKAKIDANPILIAIWCVDRPDALGRIRELVQTDKLAPTTLPFTSQVSVYEWYKRHATLEDLARRPACFEEPGVYAEMSDGSYLLV